MLNYPMFNYVCVSTYQNMSYKNKIIVTFLIISLAIVCVTIGYLWSYNLLNFPDQIKLFIYFQSSKQFAITRIALHFQPCVQHSEALFFNIISTACNICNFMFSNQFISNVFPM